MDAKATQPAGRCPKCDTSAVVMVGTPDFGFTDDNRPALVATMRCEKCRKAWLEVYLFDHVEEA
jgi:phage FluMu protein Com